MNTIVEHVNITKIDDSAGPRPAPVTASSGIAPKRRLVVGSVLMAMIAAAGVPGPAATASALPSAAHRTTADCSSLTTCYTPRIFEAAYGIRLLLQRGIDGRGETVVLPELAEPQFPLPISDIRQDLAAFDTLFHLPAARVRVVSNLAPSASPWLANGEEVLDTEMVHAVAPGAAIVELL